LYELAAGEYGFGLIWLPCYFVFVCLAAVRDCFGLGLAMGFLVAN
jgi:hypothetical protein